ncbi:MAG: restriction endonuclease subunit S [gamma proteobacterium endosymbiont of Lamellibrachia anaximandri]|nr:restriction endonuclease subunit S [gamma proteobacterium endosymbiont of Lamellibrachia anaximandri]
MWTKLTDVARLETGHTPSRRHPEYWEGEVPWIGIRDATANHGNILKSTNQYTNDLGIANSSARILPEHTVCLSRTASVGYVVVMGKPMATSQDFVNWVCDPAKLDYQFLKYLLLSENRSFLRFASGTTHQTIYFPEVKAFHVCLPSVSEQKAIAHILGTLDDKIELNRQMNATLEAMAQALFKSWFVDFDPVIDNALAAGHPIPEPLHARAEARKALGGKRKPLPEAMQKQFPSHFVFNEEMGWVPEGWTESTVGHEFEVTMGQSPPGDTYNETGDGLPFFQGRADFGFRYPSNRVYCTSPKRLASKGDALVSVRAPVGDVNMAAQDCCIGRGVSASRHKSDSRSYTYYSMHQLREHFKVYEAEGTVFGSINQKDFKALPQLCIPTEVVHTFDDYAGSFDGKIELNSEAICDLTNLRNTLLPKLLSGQLRIPDAERLIEEASC